MNPKYVVLALVLAFAIGGWAGDEMRPEPDRPVLKFLAKAARLGMWLLIVGEPAPKQQAVHAAAPDHIDHMRSL